MKMKLSCLICYALLFMSFMLEAQIVQPPQYTTPGIGVKITAVSTLGEGWCHDEHWYDFRCYLNTGPGSPMIEDRTYKFYKDDPLCHTPTYFNQDVIANSNLRAFPSYVNYSINEKILQCGGTYPFDNWCNLYEAKRLVPLALLSVISMPQTVVIERRVPGVPPAPGESEFQNAGYIFTTNFTIPKIPITGFFTYDRPARKVTIDRFCVGEPIYVDTHYKKAGEAIANARFQYEYKMDGQAAAYFMSSNVGTGEHIIQPPKVAIKETAVAWVRVRLVGPTVGSNEGLLGQWSDAKKIIIYPSPPTVDQSGIDALKPLSNAASLVEKNSTFEVHHIACVNNATGKIVIRSLNNIKGYFFSIKNKRTNEVMNYSANWMPDNNHPVTLPDDAFGDLAHANTPFRFKAGNYELKIQGMDVQTDSIFGCYSTQDFTIKEPGMFQPAVSQLKYNGFDVSCAQDLAGIKNSNGRIDVKAVGGLPPFNFSLKGYVNGTEVSSKNVNVPDDTQFANLPALVGKLPIQYKLTGTDVSGCPAGNLTNATYSLLVPDSIHVDDVDIDFARYHNYNIACYGWKDSIEVYITGGAKRYAAWIEGDGLTSNQRKENIRENVDQLIFSSLRAGNYKINVIDVNGCSAGKNFTFTQPEKLILKDLTVTPADCDENSTGSLQISAVKGASFENGKYDYVFKDWPYNFYPTPIYKRSQEATFNDLMKGSYTIYVADANGCKQQASFEIKKPQSVQVNLEGEQFICTGQSIALDAGNIGATYQWRSTSGLESSARIINASETGTYTVAVTNSEGCTGTDSFELTVDSNILQADFIASSEVNAKDTVVLINITFPLPDSAYCTLASGGRIVRSTTYYQEIVFDKPGIYPITISAAKGQCFDEFTDNITVLKEREEDATSIAGRKAGLVTFFTIHPNPSNGKFMISVQLREETPISLEIISTNGTNSIINQYQDSGKDYYEVDANITTPAGLYYVLLRAGDEKHLRRVVKVE